MFRWLQKRKEKRETKRQEKHRQILEALRAKDTSGNGSDYGFYKDDFRYRTPTTEKVTDMPHDYEEIDDFSEMPPQFSRLVGDDFRFGLIAESNIKPPRLPERTFSSIRSVSVSEKGSSNSQNFRERTMSLPCFEKKRTCNKFPSSLESDEEDQLYNEPWDCKSNLTVECEKNANDRHIRDMVQLRIYEKLNGKHDIPDDRDFDLMLSRLSLESRIYSEIEESDTGCESDAMSQSESEFSVFTDDTEQNRILGVLKQSFNGLKREVDEASDSDTSSGYYDGLQDIDEESRLRLQKPRRKTNQRMFSQSFESSFKFNTFSGTPCTKIDEDSELYLIPRRRHSLKETKSEKLCLPTRKSRPQKLDNVPSNRLLDDLIWRNNFKVQSTML